MEDWEIALVTAIIALVTSVLTTVVTMKTTHKNDILNHILAERTKFYFEIFPVIDILVNDSYKIFDRDYINEFLALKAKMKLLASQATFRVYENLFDLVIDAFNVYDKFCEKYDPREDPRKYRLFQDENGNEMEECMVTSVDLDFFESRVKNIKDSNIPDRDILCEKIQSLYQAMRTDLGSNIK